MKKLILVLILMLGLSALLTHTANAGEGPDGFANVPWGASSSQVDQAMNTQGFSKIGACVYTITDGSTCVAYSGTLVGITGTLNFWFLNDTFFYGQFALHKADGGDAARSAYGKISPIIQSKYGPPTTSRGYSSEEGTYNRWDELRTGSDSIEITLLYSAHPAARCGSSFCDSFSVVDYLNKGLKGRLLAGGNKSGL